MSKHLVAGKNKALRFIHRFNRTLSCEMQVPVKPPGPGERFSPVCLWSGGRPKRKHIAAYRQWVLFTTQTLADSWGQTIAYGLGTAPNRTELWYFEPGKPPKLVKRLNAGIPCL